MGTASAENLERYFQASRPGVFLLAGFAGALTEEFQTGDLILGTNTSTLVLRAKAENLLQSCGYRVHAAQGCTTDGVINGIEGKKALRTTTGASFVDMESEHVWRVCQEHAIPMLTLRVILDPVDFVFRWDLKSCIRPETGTLHLGKFLRQTGWDLRNWQHVRQLQRMSIRAGQSLKNALTVIASEFAGQ